jgi:hypothetical protein
LGGAPWQAARRTAVARTVRIALDYTRGAGFA